MNTTRERLKRILAALAFLAMIHALVEMIP